MVLQNPRNHIIFIIQILFDPKPIGKEMFILRDAFKKKYPTLSYEIITI